ncbi:hypothetical protein [Streptomyces sp. NPDC060035]|uniref:hypothetical protein n=1 Tax=Streptomyces sp. NPDC060035 TaxID=3347044 RepID=UPI0036D1D703
MKRNLKELDASFEQHCEGGDPAARGEVHIDNPAPPAELGLAVALDGKASTPGHPARHGELQQAGCRWRWRATSSR